MADNGQEKGPGKILILSTRAAPIPGADSVGQAHSSYPTNTFILRVKAPVLFPEHFYIDCFKKGISGIIIMSCGEECPMRAPTKRWPNASTALTP